MERTKVLRRAMAGLTELMKTTHPAEVVKGSDKR